MVAMIDDDDDDDDDGDDGDDGFNNPTFLSNFFPRSFPSIPC